MAGILIFGMYGTCHSYVFADNDLYKGVEKDVLENPHKKVYFNQGDLTSEQLENSRKKVAEIVKRLNNKEEIDVKKELSDYFN